MVVKFCASLPGRRSLHDLFAPVGHGLNDFGDPDTNWTQAESELACGLKAHSRPFATGQWASKLSNYVVPEKTRTTSEQRNHTANPSKTAQGFR